MRELRVGRVDEADEGVHEVHDQDGVWESDEYGEQY